MDTPAKKFMEGIRLALDEHYRHMLSENVKRGLRAKKLSTYRKLHCKE